MKKIAIILFIIFLSANLFAQKSSNPFINLKLKEKSARISKPIVLNLDKNNSETSFLNFKKDLESSELSHVPTSKELDSIFDLKFNSSKRVKSENCPKTIVCSMNYSYENTLLLAVSQLLKCQHPHYCSVCFNWNESYRYKVACSNCHDERMLYCGKTFPCPSCKGKGKSYSTIEAENNLSFESYLEKQYDLEVSYLTYYNSANDYGLYKINSYSNKGYLSRFNQVSSGELFSILILNGPNQEKIKENEDLLLTEKIVNCISKNDYLNALAIYNQLNTKKPLLLDEIQQIELNKQEKVKQLLNTNQLKEALEIYNLLYNKTEILNSLFVTAYTEKYRDTTVFLNEEKGTYFLKKYCSTKLGSHAADNYRLQISTEGVLKITNKNLNIIYTSNLDKSDINLIQKDGFMFPVKCEYIYQVFVTNTLIKLKKSNGLLIYDEYIKDSQKSTIDKLLKDGLVGRYTINYQRKDFNNALYIDTALFINYKGIGGPSNMFKSIIVPGWGVRSVTDGEKSGLPRTILTYGLLTSALVFQTMSVLDYQNYLNATSQDEITKYYTSANSNNSTSYYLAAAGLAIWIYDIVWVAKKGFDNKSEQKAFKRNLSFHFEPTIQSLAFSYKLKF